MRVGASLCGGLFRRLGARLEARGQPNGLKLVAPSAFPGLDSVAHPSAVSGRRHRQRIGPGSLDRRSNDRHWALPRHDGAYQRVGESTIHDDERGLRAWRSAGRRVDDGYDYGEVPDIAARCERSDAACAKREDREAR
jgi:hypothetical protein